MQGHIDNLQQREPAGIHPMFCFCLNYCCAGSAISLFEHARLRKLLSALLLRSIIMFLGLLCGVRLCCGGSVDAIDFRVHVFQCLQPFTHTCRSSSCSSLAKGAVIHTSICWSTRTTATCVCFHCHSMTISTFLSCVVDFVLACCCRRTVIDKRLLCVCRLEQVREVHDPVNKANVRRAVIRISCAFITCCFASLIAS